MEEISLRALSSENYEGIIRLNVSEDQKTFVAPNVNSIAESKVYPELIPMAIYAGETLVGFLMYRQRLETEPYYLMRFMIDARYQGKGYGRAALAKIVELMRALPGCDRIYLSYEPDNVFAEQLYMHFGFAPTGEYMEGEKVACLTLEKTP